MRLSTLLAPVFAVLATVTMAQMPGNNGIGSTPAQRSYINQNQTAILIARCVEAASRIVPENCAVVDPSGLLVGFIRMDNAYPGSIDISTKKARTAVLFNGLTSAQIGRMAQPGQALQEIEETNGGLIAFGGGYPVYFQNKLIGGFGVSGGTVPQDEQVAKAALSAAGFQTSSSD